MSFLNLLTAYTQPFEVHLQHYFQSWSIDNQLKEACQYAVLNGGKRFRPALVLMMAQSLGTVDVHSAAIAIELFHCSSLIADDLPCMDDDDFRRGKPTVHKKFGEATALLASYALIAAGYECICHNGEILQNFMPKDGVNIDKRTLAAITNANYNTGINGIQMGQFLDLNPPAQTVEVLFSIARQKTAALFEVSFVLGWLFGGGDMNLLDSVKQAAQAFGIAFQIADDLEDYQQDLAKGQMMNLVQLIGKEQALQSFYLQMKSFTQLSQALLLERSPFQQIMIVLQQQAEERCAKLY